MDTQNRTTKPALDGFIPGGAIYLRNVRSPAWMARQGATVPRADRPQVRPPARAGAARARPAAPPDLVGREGDLSRLNALMREHPLVTISGACGVGKTALARQLLREATDGGVAWTSLDDLVYPGQALRHIARSLGLPPAAAHVDGIVAALAARARVVVLDGCERCADEVARLGSALARACARTVIVVTSQVPLNLYAEQVLRLQPLDVPPADASADQALATTSVALFMNRARALDPTFRPDDEEVAGIGRICRDLDGLPLAIELAAARVRELGVNALAAGLAAGPQGALRLLTDSDRLASPRHHRSLLAAVQYSHRLLDPNSRKVLTSLAACPPGFSFEEVRRRTRHDAVDEWALVDIVGDLVARSLVSCTSGNPATYRLAMWSRTMAMACPG